MTYGNGYLQDIHIDDIVDWKRLQDEWAEGDYESSLDILNPNNYSNLISKYVSAEYINNLTDRLYLREIASDPSFKQDKIQVSETPPSLLNGEVYFQETTIKPYLTFSSPESFTLSVANGIKNWDGTLEYSTDTEVWTEWDGIISLSGNRNDEEFKLYIRGNENTIITGGYDKRWEITGTAVSCIGDIRTLLNYDNIDNAIMGDSCYRYMFCGTPLVTPPELPMTTLSYACYDSMFYDCSSLITAPELPAIKMEQLCYSMMFRNCTSLLLPPRLPATTLARECYYCMFYGCSSLTEAPALPAEKLVFGCYEAMFSYCSNLTTAPILPATTLAGMCYASMFSRCINLISVPELPATELVLSCYQGMFNGCVNLTTLPVLSATVLAPGCYSSMFYNCSKIKLSQVQTGEYQSSYRIPSLGTGTTANNALDSMFTNTGGTFTGTPAINTTYYTSNEVV